jgi:hypothetical protein
MLKLKDLHEGDHVIANYEGQQLRGIVTGFHREDNEVGVETDVQEFWFNPADMDGILLNEEELLKLGFQKEEREDGSVKYLKGPFRLLTHEKGNFTNVEIWYREDRRTITTQLYVHELQHHYHQMTKVDLVQE